MKKSIFRVSLVAALIALAGEAAAIGLGELRGGAVLGDRARFEIDLLGSGTGLLDPACYRLKQPAGDGSMPWLKQGTFAVRKGNPAVLEIVSAQTVSEPVFGVAVYVACGHDIIREYVVLASKPTLQTVQAAPAPRESVATSAPRRSSAAARSAKASTAAPQKAVPATPAPAPVEAAKAQAPQDGATPSDEKIKNMEATVGELQQRAAELTQKIEQVSQPAATPAAPAPAPVPAAAPVAPKPEESNWGLYGALLALLALVAGWLGWRGYSQRREAAGGGFGIPDVVVDPQRKNEREERGGVDLQVDPVAMVTPAKLEPVPPGTPPAAGTGSKLDSVMSISAATVDEHFEANPVMELAEIMLSFGRVKGAAQALQEYIDANPQDALKPWVRLMDVYRMAGMRHEFEKVARELNKNFNVQVQKWETLGEGADASVDVVLDAENVHPVASLAESTDEGIEGVAWIMEQVLTRWQDGDVLDYLNQLLRDNRGGTRTGFSMPVVNDLMFLIDLKEISNKIESEAVAK